MSLTADATRPTTLFVATPLYETLDELETIPDSPSSPRIVGEEIATKVGTSRYLGAFTVANLKAPAGVRFQLSTAPPHERAELSHEPVLIENLGLLRTGPALLAYVASEDEGIPLDAFTRELDGPDDWLSFARLMRAGLVDEDGVNVWATEAGSRVARELIAITDSLAGDRSVAQRHA